MVQREDIAMAWQLRWIEALELLKKCGTRDDNTGFHWPLESIDEQEETADLVWVYCLYTRFGKKP